MSQKTREKVYLAITAICLIICIVLLYCVFSSTPLFASRPSVHNPALRLDFLGGSQASVQSEYLITEELLQNRLAEILPSDLIKRFDIEISASGVISLEAAVSKSAMRDWLDAVGFELSAGQKIGLLLMPREISLDLALVFSQDESGGFHLKPSSLVLNRADISLENIAPGVFEDIAAGLRSLLPDPQVKYNFIFSHGAITLQKR